jgi:hypothetical protein
MTNKIALRTVEEFMSDYTPVYQPIYPLFLSKSQQYAQEVGKREFRRVQAVGDIRGDIITPKDSHIKSISVMEGKKTFKSYFRANQFLISQFQDRQGVEEVVTQVLDEHQVQADEIFMTGEGTSGSNVFNNGLFWSADPNYTLETAISNVSATDRARLLYAHMQSTIAKAKQISGNKIVLLYGSTTKQVYNSLLASSDKPLKVALNEAAQGSGLSFIEVPDAPTPASSEGWIVANLDQTKLHYNSLPQLMAQGNNEEKMHLWFNFIQGSFMLECLAKDAVVRQPVTYA